MEIVYKEGNILDTESQVIVHQVNSVKVMGSGVAKCIRDKYPEVYEAYRQVDNLFGKCQIIRCNDGKFVANLGGQFYYSGFHGIDWDDEDLMKLPYQNRFTNYEALYRSLSSLRNNILSTGGGIRTIALPYNMSCGRGGGDWRVVLSMIESIFENLDIKIEIWKYEK